MSLWRNTAKSSDDTIRISFCPAERLGYLGIRLVYHHLYDFGTVPAFCAFGRKRHAEEIKDGEIVEQKYMDLKFNLDERICDGFYYARVIKYFLRLLSHPDVLDNPPDRVEKDIP